MFWIRFLRTLPGALALSVLAVGLMAYPTAAQTPAPETPAPKPNSTPEQTQKPAKKPTKFSRKALINPLLDKLAEAKDEQTAHAIAQAIQRLWAQHDSPTVGLLLSQVNQALARKEESKALVMLDAIIEIAPEFAEGWNRRATVLYQKNSYDTSMADIGKVLELEPRHFGALAGLGFVMRELGDKKTALNAFRRALSIHPFLKGALRAVKELAPEVEGQGI